MFAIFFHENMNPFHEIVTSFPTVFFTLLLIIFGLYWAVAALGLVDLEILDFDMNGDVDATDSANAQTVLAGVLFKFGLNGVPLTVIVTIISMVGWVLSYYLIYFGAVFAQSFWLLELAFELLVFVLASYVSILITAQVIKPIRFLFKKLDTGARSYVVGQVAIVRSGVVDKKRGVAVMNDGGAGLLLQVRARGESTFLKGDEVVVIDHDQKRNLFHVIAKSEFSEH